MPIFDPIPQPRRIPGLAAIYRNPFYPTLPTGHRRYKAQAKAFFDVCQRRGMGFTRSAVRALRSDNPTGTSANMSMRYTSPEVVLKQALGLS